jgi:phage repressor protein C with HTH and peptisase S24 domain
MFKLTLRCLERLKMKHSELLACLQKLTQTKISQQTIATLLGVRQSAIGNRATKDGKYSLDELMKIEEHMGLVPGSLSGIQINDNCINLDYFSDVWASCGNGAVVFEETNEKISVPTSLIQNYSKSNKYSVINARGDSMTPFLQDRDKLIVEHWNGGQIIDNCIYVFRYANELFVKRLVKNITQIVIKSDNPLYEPIKIADKDTDFEVIGQIVGLMRDLR